LHKGKNAFKKGAAEKMSWGGDGLGGGGEARFSKMYRSDKEILGNCGLEGVDSIE